MTSRLQSLRARAREVPPARVDALLAALVLVEGLVEVLLVNASLAARLAAAGPLAVAAAGLLLRRREPIVAVAAGAAALALTGLLREPVTDALQGIFFAWMFLVYSLALREDGRRLVAGVAVAVAGTLAVAAATRGEDPFAEVFFGTLVFVAAPTFAGRMVHGRVQLSRALRERAERAGGEEARRAEDAAAAERARIAGELHDVVAHALGAMTVQASAARRLATKAPDRAGEAFEAIEMTGREALAELRTLLDVLRGDEDAAPAFEPQPGLAALGDLATRAADHGLAVTVEVTGDRPERVVSSIDLTAYRIIQEALSEALRNGEAGRAHVRIGYDEDRLTVEVTDDGLRVASRQLLGLRERVRLYGGRVEAGADRTGGHAVRASLPLEREGAAA